MLLVPGPKSDVSSQNAGAGTGLTAKQRRQIGVTRCAVRSSQIQRVHTHQAMYTIGKIVSSTVEKL